MKNIILLSILMIPFYCFSQEKILLYPNGASEGNFAPKVESDANSQFIVDVNEARMYYYPAEKNKKNKNPAILILPGGGYGGLAVEHEGSKVAKYMNSLGISAFVLYYRMPFHHSQIPLKDAKTAMEIIRSNSIKWNINSKKVGVIGFSAGGHLASTLETHFDKSNRPDFAALIYPVISFRPEFNPGGTRNNLLGENPTEEEINFFSSELHVTKKTPPTFIVHAIDDNVVEVKHSKAFAEALSKKGVKYKLILYPKGGHGFGMNKQGLDADFWNISLKKWLEEMKIINLPKLSKKNYNLVWKENFNGNKLDSSVWTNEQAKPGWVNNELQHYTNGENAEIKNGILRITARYENNEYTSARLITRDKKIFTYGIMEIKAKLPKGVGTWPAIWMLGNNINQVSWPACGELDIMEHVGKHPNFIHTTIHNPSGYGATPYTDIVEINDPFNTWHIYGMEWTKDFITFFVDGIAVYHYEPIEKNEKNWPFYLPAYFILNIAIGGNWGGPVVDDSIFPVAMDIDWIKVYEKK
ncbi:MAG: family 16 glycosylhydrolase [Paludibacteraceae bacterium]